MEIRTVGVLGCGLMGSGIAEIAARAGFRTIVREVNEQLLGKGLDRVQKSLSKAVERGKLDAAERDAVSARLSGTTSLADLADCELVIEAIIEDLAVKHETFQELDRRVKPGAIFASNTSSLTITQLAMATQRPDRVIGLHFFNPVPVMKLVEVVRTLLTADDALADAMTFARAVGKEPIACRDNSGFIVNRLLVPYLLDAIRALEEGVGSIEDIGHAARLRLPHGSFHLARLCRARHYLLHRQHHVRRISRKALCAAAPAQADGASRTAGPQERSRLLCVWQPLAPSARWIPSTQWPAARIPRRGSG
jgi:3-hydroxybutyryl-CoA dehydrogenase